MSRRALVLQHHPVEVPGVFGEVLGSAPGWTVETVRPDLGQPVPEAAEEWGLLLVMGGPMGVYEEAHHPWLAAEDRLLRRALERQVPALGICLGSQLIAKAGGARVAPGPEKEIGWYAVTLTEAGTEDPLLGGFPRGFEAFEWHGDVFDLPAGAVTLAASARYRHQAFRLGRAWGLLFHLEVTAAMVRAMLGAFADEVAALGDPGRAGAITTGLERRVKPLNDLARDLFQRFLALAEAG